MDDLVVRLCSTRSSVPWLPALLLLSCSAAQVHRKGIATVHIAFGAAFRVGPCRIIRGETSKRRAWAYVRGPGGIFPPDPPAPHHPQRRAPVLRLLRPDLHRGHQVGCHPLPPGPRRPERTLTGGRIDQSRAEPAVDFRRRIGAATGFLFVLVLACNILAGALQDALDPGNVRAGAAGDGAAAEMVYLGARHGPDLGEEDVMAGKLVKQLAYPGGKRFEVVVYDLLAEPTDAIVNAANGGLSHGGGVAAAIAGAAGQALDEECERIVRERGRVPVGAAVVTTAGDLPFKGVIHAVGPRLGEGDEEDKIIKALWSSFLRAHEQGWESVSFPGISSGIFSVPPDICARAYLKGVERFWKDHPDSSVSLIRLVLFDGPLLEAVKEAIAS